MTIKSAILGFVSRKYFRRGCIEVTALLRVSSHCGSACCSSPTECCTRNFVPSTMVHNPKKQCDQTRCVLAQFNAFDRGAFGGFGTPVGLLFFFGTPG